MNGIFLITILAATAMLAVVNPENYVKVMTDGAADAVELTLKLLAVYAVWLSVLEAMERSGLCQKTMRVLHPLTNRLFKGESDEAKKHITLNLTSNVLGLGGAATPAGIKAIQSMDSGGTVATKNMIMLVVINATSIQLIPATVMSLMAQHGSTNPSAIMLPSIIATAVSTASGVILVKTFCKK